MSSTEAEPIFIRATSKRNGITTLIIGITGLLLSALWLSVAPEWLFLAGVFLTSASIVTLLIGWFKLREPDHSIEISPAAVVYHHRLGNWRLDWDNIQRIDCPRVARGLEQVELEAIGFRLKSYDPFLRSVSPRLATHILMEQRPLLMQNPDTNCSTGACYGHEMFDDKHFQLADGEVLSGVKAMLANRMTHLRERLGYDVFISSADLDREPLEFVSLMRQCQQTRHQVLGTT
ncbi:DUF2982 domain-containing protein [Alteromonas pelagimontana]|uniref:DUF2982 domain-containing protein n=1 Tax=Alteromonas pelagimontana TaxID=1858656 RepID=A0A6M4MBQ5_9ALTE|nr:DUF2982 domain-containing protein [Alteromonas pelagimontana]QJR80573.1 DUF2982 domain-containing protein [Alteromonas pelagimontana]